MPVPQTASGMLAAVGGLDAKPCIQDGLLDLAELSSGRMCLAQH